MTRLHTVGDVVERFRVNSRGYLHPYRVWLWIVGLAALADFGSTVHFMLRDGVGGELHPVIRVLSVMFGPVVGPLLGKVGQMGAVLVTTIFLRAYALYIFLAATILYAWAAWYNVWGAELYDPRFMKLLMWSPG